jgi:hypothetical protein
MGCYINPKGMSKEEWLRNNAKRCNIIEAKASFTTKGSLPVVLIDNGLSTAAGICYNEREFEAFTDPDDDRPKKYYVANIVDLVGVSPILDYLPKTGGGV